MSGQRDLALGAGARGGTVSLKEKVLDFFFDLLEFAALCLMVLPLAIVATVFFIWLGQIIGFFF
jgi:K+-transporting ATPase A subunit